ncbi:MAG: serine/threonine protein kinase [Polyangiaceae bacterium]|nr:serine/threonine protein kinase [Polyangiaceae bacterium]MCE7889957.1 serine/threonine protein kinase [Sorangiineae bacterium PRO1]
MKSAANTEAFASTIGAIAGTSSGEAPAPPAHGVERFELLREIGRGGMGRVLEAKDGQFGRHVAVKELARDVTDVGHVRRFVVEALVTGNLEHPGIPAVYERGSRAGVPYYAMRHVRGRPFSEVLGERKTLRERLKLLPPVVQVAHTLGFAHERGVVHRDVKPDNIMLAPHGEVVLLDWGIAKVRGVDGGASSGVIPESHPVASESTREGAIVGTPAYLSPEQASGQTDRIDERTDVFALGALLYHVVAGRPPYAGPSVAAVVARAAEADFEPLEQLAPEAPAALRAIIEKAMARLPDDRYGSAAELADALEAFLAGAVLSRPSRVLAALAWAGAVAALLGMLAGSAQLWAFTPTLREQGLGALIVLFLAAAFLLLALTEWRTRGRYCLSPLLLALAGASFMLGLAGTFTGLSITLNAAAAAETPSSAILLSGVYETSGALVTASIVTAFELVIWSLLRRVAPEPAAGAATGASLGIGARFRSMERR